MKKHLFVDVAATERELSAELSDLILDARTYSGRTIAEVCRYLHVHRNTVANWESGRTMPSIVQLILLADLYDCHPSSLLPNP